MKTTLYDKNGNMIVAIENSDPVKSSEAVDKGLIAGTAFVGALVLSLIGFKIDDIRQAKKDKKHAEEIERLKKEAIAKKDELLNSNDFKMLKQKLNGLVQFTYNYLQTGNAKFKQLVDRSQNEYVKKYKTQILNGLSNWTVEKIKTEFANSIVEFYMNETLSGSASLQTYDFTDVSNKSEGNGEWDSVFPEIDEIYDESFFGAMTKTNDYYKFMELDNYEWDDEQLFVSVLEYLGLKKLGDSTCKYRVEHWGFDK